MKIVENGKTQFTEYQWCHHLQGMPSEIRKRKLLILDAKQTAVIALGTTIACLCMECLVLFGEGRLPIKPTQAGSQMC